MSDSEKDNIRWRFLLENPSVIDWTDCTLSLFETNKALTQYAKDEAKEFLDSWKESGSLYHFIDHNRSYEKNGNFITGARTGCDECAKVFEGLSNIMESQTLFITDRSYIYDQSWLLLKLFAKQQSRDMKSFEQCDDQTLYDILGNCVLFSKLKITSEFRAVRNQIMHSGEFQVNKEFRDQCLSKMKEILEPIRYDNAAKEAFETIERLLRNGDEMPNPSKGYQDMKKAWGMQLTSLQEDVNMIKSDPNMQACLPTVKKLMELVEECKSKTETVITTDNKFEATMDEVTKMGSEKAKKIFGDNIFGKTIGSATGYAGAYAAGCYKRLAQKKGKSMKQAGALSWTESTRSSQQKQPPTRDFDAFVENLRIQSKSDVIGKELNNRTSTLMCLQQSVKIARDEIMKRMEDEWDNKWPVNLKNGFETFCVEAKCGKISFSKWKKRDKWEIRDVDNTSEDIFRKILGLSSPNNRYIVWDSDDTNAKPSWKLAKMFMPFGNKNIGEIKDVDVLAVCDLLRNCNLFKDFAPVVSQLCDLRNDTTHRLTTDISNDKKNEYIGYMTDFLELPCLSVEPGRNTVIKKLKRLQQGQVLVCHQLYELGNCVKSLLPTDDTDTEWMESTSQMIDAFNSRVMKNLVCQNDLLTRTLKEIEENKSQYTIIGSLAGANLTTGLTQATFAITGAALGPVTIIGGGIALAVGAFGGGIGGSVLNRIRWLRND